jgi:polysaccharide biosynthesis transport protein
MTLIDFIRLLRKHVVLLVMMPLLLAALVVFMTRHPDFKFASETKLYTGIASGSSVELDKSLNFYATGTAFDNLINVIKSRKTQQEVAIRLLAQHLMLEKADPKYLSAKSFADLRRITPASVRKLVDESMRSSASTAHTDLSARDSSISVFHDSSDISWKYQLPASIDPAAFERTVEALTDLMNSSDTNFVYSLLNFGDPHYSIQAIASVNVQRIGSSDLVQLKFETDDPGICQQTLCLMIDVCGINYKSIKEDQSDIVVRYFQQQLQDASERLKIAEDKLLEFNKENNIINYYEQSKAVAVVKEELDVNFSNMRIKLAGLEASIANLEEKLGNQKEYSQKSRGLLNQKEALGKLSYQIAVSEAKSTADAEDIQRLAALKKEEEKLKEQMQGQISDFNSFGSSVDGLPVSGLLQDWLDHVIEAENTRAGLEVLRDRIKEFEKQYEIYAPAGANVKRIEREISVSESEYLEILHGLNLAKLKLQDNELSSNIKVVDPPYYPLSPNKTKRKILVVMAAFAGFVIMLFVLLILEYMDNTLKNADKATRVLGARMIGLLPRISKDLQVVNLSFVVNRMLEITLQHCERFLKSKASGNKPKIILLISTLKHEGKTVTGTNLALKMKRTGSRVLFLNYASHSLQEAEKAFIGFNPGAPAGMDEPRYVIRKRASLVRKLLGYADNRVDHESVFLQPPSEVLDTNEYVEYELNDRYLNASGYMDLLPDRFREATETPDCVILELPPVLLHPYPVNLVSSADLPVLVCRANRQWTAADNHVLESLKEISGPSLHFFLSGVELQAIESVLGDLPKTRSRFRRWLKRMIRLQFTSGNQI